MAFVKLFPPDGSAPLSISDLIRRLDDEFTLVHSDPEEGQDHVAGMIAATLRFSDSLPGKAERLAWLQSVQDLAVQVTFSDDITGPSATCCVLPECELFFDSPEVVDGDARQLVERAASALGYTLYDG